MEEIIQKEGLNLSTDDIWNKLFDIGYIRKKAEKWASVRMPLNIFEGIRPLIINTPSSLAIRLDAPILLNIQKELDSTGMINNTPSSMIDNSLNMMIIYRLEEEIEDDNV